MTKLVLSAVAVAAASVLGAVVATREPADRVAVLVVVAAAALAIGCGTGAVALALEEHAARWARRPRAPRRWPALRRGLSVAVVVAALGLLRAADGLTPITGGFVIAGFLLGELVLAARPAPRPG